MAKSNEGKNRANKKLHTKLRKRKMAKDFDAKEKRKLRLKEIGKMGFINPMEKPKEV